MNLPTHLANKFVSNPWTVLVTTLGAFLGIFFVVYDHFPGYSNLKLLILWGGAVFILFLIFFSFKIRLDNRNLKEIAKSFRDINRLYQESLFQNFYGIGAVNDRNELVNIEKNVVQAVCQRISYIYSTLIRKKCAVSVKLLVVENENMFAQTYARDEINSERDSSEPVKYKVNVGRNTAFDEALKNDTTREIVHFYSGDLEKHHHYYNERVSWKQYYRSTIVVPIRSRTSNEKKGESIGFLCVDTMSRNRLNNDHHVIMLAALSDQMYNFMALMRGKYQAAVKGDQI